MKFLKYLGFGFLSVLLNTTLLSTIMVGNPINGIIMFLLIPYCWLPAILINSSLICWNNKI